MKVIGVIPARFHSTRFPGKPLQEIAKKPMIQWVYEGAKSCKELDAIYVTTDSRKIAEAVKGFGGEVILTGECKNGTERVYETVKNMDCSIVINIQGDEPLVRKEMLHDLLRAFDDKTVYMATLKKKISYEESMYPNHVKVITDKNQDAIYFSRSQIPYYRNQKIIPVYYKHIGIYAYRKDFLKQVMKLPVGEFEEIESLEQLRILECGLKIRVMETIYDSIGVDVPEDIERIEQLLEKKINV